MAIMENSISGLEGSMITYYCQWMPNEHMVATCLSNGSWSPDPRDMECPGYTTTIDTSTYSRNSTPTNDSPSDNVGFIVPVISTLLLVAFSITMIIFTFYITHWKGKGSYDHAQSCICIKIIMTVTNQ